MKDESKGEVVDVSREAIAELAVQAASEVEGVTVLQQKAVESITSKVKREFVHKGVKVSKEDGAFMLSLDIKVDYGRNLPGVALEVQRKVKEDLKGLIGVEVEDIEVVIEDIELPA